jgi:hypothetical protein
MRSAAGWFPGAVCLQVLASHVNDGIHEEAAITHIGPPEGDPLVVPQKPGGDGIMKDGIVLIQLCNTQCDL